MRDELTVNIDERMLVPTVENEDALAFSPGRYRLCFEVASGGMATVYLALYSGPLGFERAVAIKTIHRHLAKEKQFVEMFLDEARIAAHIDHPFVCKVVDFGEARDSYYIAMEYLVGEPLSVVWEMLQEKPALAASPELPWCVARVLADLAEGLHAAHELTEEGKPVGIVHRDVTPANLFVLYDGTVRVVDFGIAKARNNLHQTETGMVKGKYAYLSPEQLDHRPVDRRSDVFSLGVVAWEMLTGRRLFRRDTPMETMQAVVGAAIHPPSTYREDVSPELDAVVLRALSREPADRFPTARAFAMAVEACLAQEARAVSRAELGEWLDELCPGNFSHKRKLVELTRRGDSAMPVDLPEPAAEQAPMEPTTVHARSLTPSDAPDELLEEQIDGEEPLHESSEEPIASSSQPGDHLDRILYESSEEPEEASGGGDKTDEQRPQESERPRKRFGPLGDIPQRPPSPRTFPWVRYGVPAVLAAVAGGLAAAWWDEPPPQAPTPQSSQRQASRRVRPVPPPAAPSPAAPSPAVEASAVKTRGAEQERPRTVPPAEPGAEAVPPPDVKPGTVRVSSPEGGAEIWEDGQLIGRTEEDLSLPAGEHLLELQPYDGSPKQTLTVTVRPGRTVFTSVSFGG